MANTKISALGAASALGGTEQAAGVQSGANVNITPAQLKTYCNALVNVGRLFWPPLHLDSGAQASSLGAGSLTFDSATDRLCWVGRSPVTDTLSVVYFRTGTVTTGDTVEVRIETVTNGRPSGTLVDSATTNNAKGSVAIADGDDNVWKTATIATAASLTAGQEFAIVIVHLSGAVPNEVFSAASTTLNGDGDHYPLILQDTGAGSWTALVNPLEWVVEMTTSGVISLPWLLPLDGAGTITAFNNTTSPNERALKFVAPMACSVIGARIAMFNTAAGADFTFSLWDSTADPGAGPTPLAQTSSQDGDYAISTTQDGYVQLYFTAPYTLTAGTTYYLGVKPDTANNIGLGEMSAAGTGAATNAIRAFGIGSNTAHLSTRVWAGTDPGVWTDTTTTLPMISLVIGSVIA